METSIYSYNVNGIRAAINKGFVEWMREESPDILGIQETKMQEGQIDTSVFDEMGYHHYWYYAEKKGYSGVAVFTKIEPLHVEYGIGLQKYDREGRVIRLDFKNFSLINVYFPSGTTGDIRQKFKMEFLTDFQLYVEGVKKKFPNLIISGDYNICHKPIDINHPERHKKSSGFLPEERAWFDGFIDSGFTDSFREFNKDPENYSWWSYRAGSRAKNLGWRIDYNLVSNPLKLKLKDAFILKDVVYSDHCPVKLFISC